MNSPRVRRLQSDYERISTRFDGWVLVQVELADGMPPDMYRICYNIKGLHAAPDGHILERDEHVLEIKLGLEYPRRAPQLRLLTPLFHPNFNQAEVCAQDIYAASEGLDDLIIRIGRMISYQEYNTKSPLNGIAAKWAAENSHRLPVDRREIAPPTREAYSTTHPTPAPMQEVIQPDDDLASEIVITAEELSGPPSKQDSNIFEFDCPYCGSRLRGSPKDIGNIVQCPNCRKSIGAPSQKDEPKPSESAIIRFTCPFCQQSLEADSEMEGDEVPCPSCKNPIIV